MKTIHFSCPSCENAVETAAELSGKLTRCPSCEESLRPPRPAPKTSPSWLIAVCFILMASGVCIGIPLEQWARASSPARETPYGLQKRLQSEAQAMFMRQCTNAIVGLNRVIDQDLRTMDGDPNKWTAEVTAEYINHYGGIDRTNVPFVFWIYDSPVDHQRHVLCRVDNLKILGAERGVRSLPPSLPLASKN